MIFNPEGVAACLMGMLKKHPSDEVIRNPDATRLPVPIWNSGPIRSLQYQEWSYVGMFNTKIAMLVVLVSAAAAASVISGGRIPTAPQDEFTVRCPTEAVRSGKPLVFSVVELKTSDRDAFSKWSVDRGNITNGQNSPSITVDTTGIRNQPVTATLEVSAGGCRRTVSCTTYVTGER